MKASATASIYGIMREESYFQYNKIIVNNQNQTNDKKDEESGAIIRL
jgi:hypothetical protein